MGISISFREYDPTEFKKSKDIHAPNNEDKTNSEESEEEAN